MVYLFKYQMFTISPNYFYLHDWKPPEKATISELWVNHFIKCHPELKSKYTHQYDYQCARCEDPELIKAWFRCVEKTIQQYGIVEEDIYNIVESEGSLLDCL